MYFFEDLNHLYKTLIYLLLNQRSRLAFEFEPQTCECSQFSGLFGYEQPAEKLLLPTHPNKGGENIQGHSDKTTVCKKILLFISKNPFLLWILICKTDGAFKSRNLSKPLPRRVKVFTALTYKIITRYNLSKYQLIEIIF